METKFKETEFKELYFSCHANGACELQLLPEEGVVFYADLPQTLRGPLVGQPEAYGALKLFILSGGGWGGEGGGGSEGRESKGGEEEKKQQSEGAKCRERGKVGSRMK